VYKQAWSIKNYRYVWDVSWTPVHSFTFILPFTFTSIIYFLTNKYLLPHDTFNPLFTANRWDWQPHCKLGQSTLVVLCEGSTLLLVQSYAPDKAPYINCLEQSPSQLASTFESWFFLLLVWLNLGFILIETCRCAHHTFLLGFPTGWLSTANHLAHLPIIYFLWHLF
jgi:hypothetical protein